MSTSISNMFQGQGLTKQGIVDNDASSPSLRRSLSTDMSSKNWLSQNGFSPMKRSPSSQQLSLPHSHIKLITPNDNKAEQFDTWSSILFSHKEETSKLTTIPYVHPLVKRSKSCLSEKSLEICTESLGSETGSDGFSSYPPSETEDSEEDKEEEVVTVIVSDESRKFKLYDHNQEELELPKHNHHARKKSIPGCFPPPLPSLSSQNGSSLHMQSHRDNGSLFLQVVSVPSHNNFSAQREDGRLVLTFTGQVAEEKEQEEKDDVDEFKEDDEAEEVEDLTVAEQAPMLSYGITNFHSITLTMNKPIGLLNRSPKWSQNFNDDFEYYWRSNSTALIPNKLVVSGERKRTSNGDYLVLNLKSCKDSEVFSVLGAVLHCHVTRVITT